VQPVTVHRVLRGFGTALLAAGVLVLLFVAYELWGTGLTTASHQRALRQQFEHELRVDHVGAATPAAAPMTTTTTTTTLPVAGVVAPASPAAPVANGQPIGIIQIPEIGVDYVVVQGTDEADLELGPGHYLGTPMPGNPGNAAIAGHRTTYLHPFYSLNELSAGDPIFVTTAQGRFRYDVKRALVVAPTDVAVLDPTATPTLTLTTCNPRYSAATRLVVTASLVSPAVPPAAAARRVPPRKGRRAPTLPASGAGLAGNTGSWGAALWWGLACVCFAGAVWAVHRRVRHWWVYAAGTLGLLGLLFFFFGALSQVLPAGY